ncbi:MAG: hypothetical protein E7458_09500 [Ruminococcaceae bacterium]|nr:hypothetical protein [Oscillospiraceae bacterium]
MTKKILALLLAVLMLMTLFTACAEDKKDDADDKSSTATDDKKPAEDSSKEDDAEDEAPVEAEMKTISWFGYEANQWDYTMVEAQHFATWKEFMRIANEDYGIEVDWSTTDQTAYLTTLNGYIAANTLPNSFYAWGQLPDDSYIEMINNNRFAPMDDILEYATESAPLFEPDGKLGYLRAWAMTENGNWYSIKVGNNTANSIDLSNSTTKQRVPVQVHGPYGVSIRQDWLNKLGLALPTTLDEYYDALKAFQDNDINGNGAADERHIEHLGTASVYRGIGQWFGLPGGTFVENPGSGVVEVPHLMDGYKPWLSFMNKLYNDTLILNNDGGSQWSYSVYCGGNYCSSYTVMHDYLWRTETGDPDADYEPLPLIQGVEGIVPRFTAQEAVAGGSGITFAADVDLDAAGRFVDFLHSQAFALVFERGIEGVAWDWADDGTIVSYPLTEEQDEFASPRTTYLDYSGLPSVHIDNVWGVKCTAYDSVEEALNAGECYTEEFMTQEEWKENYNYNGEGDSPATKFLKYINEFGEENFNPAIVYSFMTPPTADEAKVVAQYKTELVDTYLLELTTNTIVGQFSIDEVDEKIQYAYDNLGLQEYYDVMQARYNRFLDAMGLEVVG